MWGPELTPRTRLVQRHRAGTGQGLRGRHQGPVRCHSTTHHMAPSSRRPHTPSLAPRPVQPLPTQLQARRAGPTPAPAGSRLKNAIEACSLFVCALKVIFNFGK